MTTPTLHILYAEFGRERTPLAWRDGVLLGEDQANERQDLHRTLSELVRRASTDRTESWGRVVRAGTRVMVETRADHGSGSRRVDVTVVLEAPAGNAEFAFIAADIGKLLTDEGVIVDADRLSSVLQRACAEGRSGPFGESLGRLLVASAALGVTFLIWRRISARRGRRSPVRL